MRVYLIFCNILQLLFKKKKTQMRLRVRSSGYLFCIKCKQTTMESDARSQDFDEEMIAMVRRCPFLFDNARYDFKDVAKRQKAWETIGKALGQRPSVVERRWMSLRNQYSKKIREEQLRSLSGCQMQTWRKGNSLTWLKPFIKGRRRRKDVLRLGQMSEWSTKAGNHVMANASGNGDPLHTSLQMMGLPDNVTLPRSIEYSVVTPSASNGEASTSSQSPPWSNHPDNHVDRLNSSSSSSSFVRSFQCSSAPSINEDQRKSPNDTYQSDYENSHEYKPFELCEVQDNSPDVVSMVGMVREVVRQEMSFEDEDALFAKSIAQMLRRMDRPKRNKTKVRLLQLLSEIDEEEPV